MKLQLFTLFGHAFGTLCRFKDLLLIWLALMNFSGIITTILGKTATNSKDTGRDIRVHHSKSLPLPFIGERFFFSLEILYYSSQNTLEIQIDTLFARSLIPISSAEVCLSFLSESSLKTWEQ